MSDLRFPVALKAKAAESISPSRSGDACRESPRLFNITAAPLAACRSYKISAEYWSGKIYSKKRHQKGSSIGRMGSQIPNLQVCIAQETPAKPGAYKPKRCHKQKSPWVRNTSASTILQDQRDHRSRDVQSVREVC